MIPPEGTIQQSAETISNKISKCQRERPLTRRSIKFRKSTTSRIKIEMSSTAIEGFLKPPHSILVDGSYSKWVDALERERPKTYKIRGHDRPIPGIISGHLDMYERDRRDRKHLVELLRTPRMTLPEPRRKEAPDSKVVQELEKKLEKRNASILGKIIPFMVEMFANFSFHDKNEKKDEKPPRPQHLPGCTCQDEESPLPFVNADDYVYSYSYT